MDPNVAQAVQNALSDGEVLPPAPASPEELAAPLSDPDDGELLVEEPLSEEEEPTAEDLAFINDGKADVAEVDAASVDQANIITGKRRRKAPTRWQHPDTEAVMRQYMKRKGITVEDLDALNDDDGAPAEDEEASSDFSEELNESDVEGESEYNSEFDDDDDDEDFVANTDDEDDDEDYDEDEDEDEDDEDDEDQPGRYELEDQDGDGTGKARQPKDAAESVAPNGDGSQSPEPARAASSVAQQGTASGARPKKRRKTKQIE